MFQKIARNISLKEKALNRSILNYICISAVIFLFFSIFYISILSPPMGDTWGYIVLSKDRSPWDMINLYIAGYMRGNPRLGQYVLMLSGYSQFYTATVNSISLILLLVGSVMVIKGRDSKFNPWENSIILFIVFSVLTISGSEIGLAFFYVPFNSNYVFGFGFLLVFLGLVRAFPHAKGLPLVLIATIGFLAGLTNEHTPPFFIAVGFFAILLSRVKILNFDIRICHYVSYISFLVGYLFLFFAPGQQHRYGASVEKNQGFSALLSDFPDRIESVSRLLFKNSVPVYLLCIILLLISTIVAWRRRKLPEVVIPWLFLLASLGMAATVLASPLVGQRLLFASYAALGVSVAATVYYLRYVPFLFLFSGLFSAILTAMFLYNGFKIYIELNESYVSHLQIINKEKSNGIFDVVIEPYYSKFRENHEYVRNESFSSDPDQRLNKARAIVFGLDSISYVRGGR